MDPESTCCEACEAELSTIVEVCDDKEAPCQLCKGCHDRLLARALRPTEWYNLAKRHSWRQYLLHDDFYDEDGTASQPEDDVIDAGEHDAPQLSGVAGDPFALLDYSITRWWLTEDIKSAWRSLSASVVLLAISIRFFDTSNPHIRSTCLQIAAFTQGEDGAEFVRRCWKEYPAVDLMSLAEASSACLPFREGFDRVCAALAELEGSRKRDLMVALSYFRSTDVLDWIEGAVFQPVTENWGYLAAASDLDWQRVEIWLASGRPLSLVAIDALGAIVRPMSVLLRQLAPTLRNPPSGERFRSILTEYMRLDPVPRVQQRIDALLLNGDALTVKA